MKAIEKLRVECLVLAQTFETLWAYYLQSSGQLYGKHCRDSALSFLQAVDELAIADPQVKDSVSSKIGFGTDFEDILTRLREWASEVALYPYESHFKSWFMLWASITSLKAVLIKELGLTRFPIMVVTSGQQEYSENYVKWSGHLSPRILRADDPDMLVQKACLTPTVVIVGDIRRSQDLMTYSSTAESFSIRMVEFITQTRLLLNKRSGFFDKFTGDGFLAYFNEAICREVGTNYLECSLEFLHDLLEFSSAHFADWTKEVKKLPESPVGLAIGADLGIVSFQNLNHHLVAVGDAIVWASRMASCANANEIVVNNLLFEALRTTPGVQFQERAGKTKSGEGFLARILLLPEVKAAE